MKYGVKNLLVVFLALILVVSSVGCSSTTTQASETSAAGSTQTSAVQSESIQPTQDVTLEFWMLPLIDEAKIKEMVQAFDGSKSGIKVNTTVLDWSTGREQIKQAVAAGSGPDLFYIGAGLDQAYIDANLLLPLDQAGFTTEDLDRYSPLIAASMVDDKVLAAPISYETYILYYRKDILAEYGYNNPPKTWDEMKAMAKTITEKSGGEIMGYQAKGADDHLNAINYSWQTMLQQAGGNLFDVDAKKAAQDSPEARQALTYMKSFYDEKISTLGTSAANGFREGKVAMFEFTQGPIYSEKYISDETLKGKWGVATLPAGPSTSAGHLGGHAIAINAASKNPQQAGEFLKWFLSPQNAPVWMDAAFALPVFDLDKIDQDAKTAIDAVINKNPDIWKALLDQAAASDPKFMIQSRFGYTARWDGQKRLIVAALNNQMSIDDVLSQLDAEVNQSVG